MTNLSRGEEKLRAKMMSKLRNVCRSRNQNNTPYKTKSDLNAWKKSCESLKESRAIENIPANERDLLLSRFFISVRKQMALSTSRVLLATSSEVFKATFLFGHTINIFLTELGWSVWENLNLGR